MNFTDAFNKAAKNPVVKYAAIGAGVGLAAAALPVIGIFSGPLIGGAIGAYYGNKKNDGGPK
jgi:uncharacterized protein YqgC (DUF456 family)